MIFDKRLGSSAGEVLVNYHSDWGGLNTNLRLRDFARSYENIETVLGAPCHHENSMSAVTAKLALIASRRPSEGRTLGVETFTSDDGAREPSTRWGPGTDRAHFSQYALTRLIIAIQLMQYIPWTVSVNLIEYFQDLKKQMFKEFMILISHIINNIVSYYYGSGIDKFCYNTVQYNMISGVL